MSPRPGGSATRWWPTCGLGLRARGSRGRSGLAAARKAGRALGGAAEAATTVAAGAGDEVASAIARGERGGEEGAARGRGSERGEDGLGFCCFYTMGERLEPLDRGWTVKNSWAIWAEMGLLCITFFFFFFDFIVLL